MTATTGATSTTAGTPRTMTATTGATSTTAGTTSTTTGTMTGARTLIPALTSSGLRAALKTATVALKTTTLALKTTTLALKTTTLTLKMAMVVATKLTTRTATSHPLSTSRPLSPLTIHHHHHSHGHHHHNHVHHHGHHGHHHHSHGHHHHSHVHHQLATLKVAREKRARARARAKAKAMTCSRRASSPTTPRMTFRRQTSTTRILPMRKISYRTSLRKRTSLTRSLAPAVAGERRKRRVLGIAALALVRTSSWAENRGKASVSLTEPARKTGSGTERMARNHHSLTRYGKNSAGLGTSKMKKETSKMKKGRKPSMVTTTTRTLTAQPQRTASLPSPKTLTFPRYHERTSRCSTGWTTRKRDRSLRGWPRLAPNWMRASRKATRSNWARGAVSSSRRKAGPLLFWLMLPSPSPNH